MTEVVAIDLFCGVGGLTSGLKAAGINVIAGVDLDAACQFPFEFNNDSIFLKKDIGKLSSDTLLGLFRGSQVSILAGCAPCQPFSTYSHRYDVIGSSRWELLYHFARLVKGGKPDIIVMENVPSLVKHQVFDDFRHTLLKRGYFVSDQIVDCSEYGLPQRRKRFVLLASRLGPISLNETRARRIKTVRDAIADLPYLEHGQLCSSDPLHVASRLSPLNLRRIKASKQGGTWRDWPKSLIAECHRKPSGKTYPGVYGRMCWDAPSPTLTTQFYGFGNGRYGHPDQDRAISLREGAILQGFPKRYQFVSSKDEVRFKELGRLIGNAVPVALGRVIGESINKHLKSMDTALSSVSIKRIA